MMNLRGRLLRPDSHKRVSGIPGAVQTNQSGGGLMKKLLTLLVLFFCYVHALAGEITVEACVSATVTFESSPGAISGFPETCINLAASVVGDIFNDRETHSDSETITAPWGGCNETGADVEYTMEFKRCWCQAISTACYC